LAGGHTGAPSEGRTFGRNHAERNRRQRRAHAGASPRRIYCSCRWPGRRFCARCPLFSRRYRGASRLAERVNAEHSPSRASAARDPRRSSLRASLAAAARVLFTTFLFMVCGAGVMALMPVLGREMGYGALGYGLLLGSLGVGAVSGGALLSYFRSRLAPEMVIAAGFIVFAAAAVGAGTLRELFLLCPVMFLGGIAWLSVLSTCMVAAQEASPPWVRARVMAIYLMVFQAGIAGGSALWGAVASHAGLSAAYFGIAGGLVLGAAVALRLKPAAGKVPDFTPAH